MLNEFGETYLTLGDLEQAIKAYTEGLAIAERLAASDPGSTKWQRDVWVSYGRLGDALVETGKLEAALKAYRDALALAERLSAAEPANKQWQYDVSFSHVEDRRRVGRARQARRGACRLPNRACHPPAPACRRSRERAVAT
jgi:tetratricopeptide (TPR) repeat protein